MRLLGALLLLLALPPADALLGAPAAAEPPPGCSLLDEATWSCRWVYDGLPPENRVHWALPAFERTLATFQVTLLQAPDTGWMLFVVDPATGEEVSRAHHNANPALSARHSAESTHVLIGATAYELVLQMGAPPANPRTAGRYEVSYLGREIPLGGFPSRPAATAEDPHLRDAPGDVEDAAWDIRAAWFGDALLDDGLMDVHLRVGDLANLSTLSFRAPTAEGPERREVFQVDELAWKVAWNVTGRRYYVEWSASRPTSAEPPAYSCVLRTEEDNEQLEEILAHPLCEVDVANATFHAIIPEASIGSPPVGQIFERMEARSRARYLPTRATDTLDDRGEVLYAFALGGPSVWSALNPRLDPPPAAWYRDPFASEHIADTLQVAGSVAALATFLVGLFLVYRRRRHTSELLARVDAVAEKHEDQRGALLALGRLEEEFAAMFRRHKISDNQYQVLSQRIATVATRYALRTSLGLDDGVPGEASPARRLDVTDPREKRVRP